MRLQGKALEQRLSEFSKPTHVLIMQILPISHETSAAVREITPNSELTEGQVVAALKRLKHELGMD